MYLPLPIHDDLILDSNAGHVVEAASRRIWTYYVALRLMCWSFGVAALLLGASVVANLGSAQTSVSIWLLFAATTFVAFSHEIVWQRTQNSGVGRKLVADLMDRIPQCFADEMDRYASGVSRARTSDGLTPIELFQTAFSIALWSPMPKLRVLARSKQGAREHRPLFPYVQASEPSGEPSGSFEDDKKLDCRLAIVGQKAVRRWAPAGWIQLPGRDDIIAAIKRGAPHPIDARLCIALDAMKAHAERDHRKRPIRSLCIKAATDACSPGAGYSASALGQIYDGRYEPIFTILGMATSN